MKRESLHKRYIGVPSSIHPQGWVPVETIVAHCARVRERVVAFTPKGGCPLKLLLRTAPVFGSVW